MRTALLLSYTLALAGCAGGKIDPADDFADIVDEKSDSFSSKMKIVASLPDAPGDVAVPYTASPLYRAVKLHARSADLLKITVASQRAKVDPKGGDPVTWLLDSSFHVVAKNDDVSG